MATEIITKEDLNEFRELLLNDFKALLQGKPIYENTKWLKSYQVKHAKDIAGNPSKLKNQWYDFLYKNWRNTLLQV
jgi:hypothetical protein